MKVFYLIPAEKISSYVQSIIVIESTGVKSPFIMPLFANGTPALLFSTAVTRIGSSTQNLILFGQTIIPGQLLIEDDFKMVAYFMKPYALGPLFNISASELTDRPIGLDLLSGNSEIKEQLLNATTTNHILQLMDDFLFRKIRAIRTEDNRLHYAAEKIIDEVDKNVMTALQQELYITERTFQRMFKQHIGLSPNLFRRINQFNRAFRQINEERFGDLSSVAYRNGYADQSHFTRVFKEFTNFTPTGYLRARPVPE
jgi:AraC-like DNA-binding protein